MRIDLPSDTTIQWIRNIAGTVFGFSILAIHTSFYYFLRTDSTAILIIDTGLNILVNLCAAIIFIMVHIQLSKLFQNIFLKLLQCFNKIPMEALDVIRKIESWGDIILLMGSSIFLIIGYICGLVVNIHQFVAMGGEESSVDNKNAGSGANDDDDDYAQTFMYMVLVYFITEIVRLFRTSIENKIFFIGYYWCSIFNIPKVDRFD